jgi:ABC-2 type transport system permease protein
VWLFREDDMAGSMRLWGAYVRLAMRSQLQYRASFIMQVAGRLVMHGLEVVVIVALFSRFGSIQGWRMAEVLLLYGIVHISFAIAEGIARGFDIFSQLVKSGDFDMLLLRPRSTVLQVAVREFQLLRIGRLAQGLAVLVWGMMTVGITWHWYQGLILLSAMAGATCMFYALFVLQATASFWTIESLEFMNMFTYGGVQVAQYPLEIYQKEFQRFFIFIIPLGCVTYFPVVALLGREDAVFHSPVWLQCAAPMMGVLFLAISLRVWEFGVRHYRSTGS